MRRTIKTFTIAALAVTSFLGLAPEMASAKMMLCKYHNLTTIDGTPLPMLVPEITLFYDVGPFTLQDALAMSSQEGVRGNIMLVNTSPKKITWYLIIVQMQWGNEATDVVSIPIFNRDRTGKSALRFSHMAWVYGRHGRSLDPPLLPGEKRRISFSSFEMMDTCPTSAKISVLNVQYSDGDAFDHESAHLSLAPPALLAAPLHDVVELEHRNKTAIFGLLHVSIDGHADGFDQLNTPDPEVKEFLANLMRDWVFTPAVENGNRIDAWFNFAMAIGDPPSEWNTLIAGMFAKNKKILVPFHILPPSSRQLRERWVVANSIRDFPSKAPQ